MYIGSADSKPMLKRVLWCILAPLAGYPRSAEDVKCEILVSTWGVFHEIETLGSLAEARFNISGVRGLRFGLP